MMAYLLGSGVALGCLYMIGKELLPSRMSANHLFNEAFDVVKADHEVCIPRGECAMKPDCLTRLWQGVNELKY